MDIIFIDRQTGEKTKEKVYGDAALKLLYGNGPLTKIFGAPLLHLIAKTALFAKFYGWLQNRSYTRKKISPFIKKYQIDPKEFVKKPEEFTSFNDFFSREIKPRTLSKSPAIIPADGRYLFFQDISKSMSFQVKGKKFSLPKLLQSEELANTYSNGTLIIGRLCPTDYHRFHFPCDCIPSETRLINGWLYAVNPIAIKKNIHIFTENKRTLCTLETEQFGNVLYLEVGATCVGSIHQTYTPNKPHKKGDEKGYFSFGGSALMLLFPKGSLILDKDLTAATKEGFEIRCLLGQSMGV